MSLPREGIMKKDDTVYLLFFVCVRIAGNICYATAARERNLPGKRPDPTK